MLSLRICSLLPYSMKLGSELNVNNYRCVF